TGNEATHHVYRAMVLANLPGGEARARAAYADAQKASTPGISRLYPQTALRVLGRLEEARAASREVRRGGFTVSSDPSGWYNKVLDFYCGDLSAERLLEIAGASRWHQCEAHYAIALDHLARGDRVKAREHFQKVIDTRVWGFTEFSWAQTFLACMDRDPK